MAPTTSPEAPTTTPVVQPYVGSPPTSGSAFTTRLPPVIRLASSFASSCPAAFSTGAAAFLAAASLTTGPSPPDGLQVAPLQLSVPGVFRLNVHDPGAARSTRSVGPEPSCPPIRQAPPCATGLPSSPSAFASVRTCCSVISPRARYTGAEPGPSGSAPAAR